VRSVALALVLVAAAAPARSQSFQEQFATCLACHGEADRSAGAEVPYLGGQPALFVMFQLFMFREGQRTNPAMDPFAKSFTDDNLRRYSEAITKLPPPRPPAEVPDAARYEHGKALAARGRCDFCHNPDYSGKDQTPRIAHQREDYLVKSLHDYKAGRRIGTRAAMAEAVHGLSDTDIADLAHYIAHFR